jgi:hypothetical protein
MRDLGKVVSLHSLLHSDFFSKQHVSTRITLTDDAGRPHRSSAEDPALERNVLASSPNHGWARPRGDRTLLDLTVQFDRFILDLTVHSATRHPWT